MPKFRLNWDCHVDEVRECGVIVSGGEIVAPHPSQNVSIFGNFFVWSTATKEHSIKENNGS